ncbi:MAG: DUF1698 domain-containing protein [Bryobacteraceae bacterium]|nr:DUF1698 domain-containing protein [Bryobacteraceae bacterium]
MQLPNGRVLQGVMDLEFQKARWDSFRLPADLTGRTLLDIGPWDGFFTFEAERRGAAVTAIDYVDLDTFRELHRLMTSNARYLRLEVYDLSPQVTGTFDIVLCLGVLYHLKHPLLALERICSVTTDLCVIDTFVTDAEAYRTGVHAPLPSIEFYERDELAGQLDNWCGPSVSAVCALARSAGFAFVEPLSFTESTARFVCWRKWPLQADATRSVEIVNVSSHQNAGKSFRSTNEEYIQLWFRHGTAVPSIGLSDVFPAVDGFGVPPLVCYADAGVFQVNFRLPPGLEPGTHLVTVSTRWSASSQPIEIFVDLAASYTPVILNSYQDGVNWDNTEVSWENGGWITLWVTGLTEQADPGNTVVLISGIPHAPVLVDSKSGQINVRLRPLIGAGCHQAAIAHRSQVSNDLSIIVSGTAPRLRGFAEAYD